MKQTILLPLSLAATALLLPVGSYAATAQDDQTRSHGRRLAAPPDGNP